VGVKRLIIYALLAQLIALPIIAIEARDIFSPADPSCLSVPALGNNAPKVLMTGSPAPILVNQVAEKLLRQKSRETIPSTYEHYIKQVATSHGVSPALVKAVIQAESSFRPQAVSKKGAIGLMQLMPKTAGQASVRHLFNPHYNIKAGVRYLKKMLNTFDGDEILALAAYNTGPRKVKRYGGVPPFRETRVFVRRVMSYYRSFQDS